MTDEKIQLPLSMKYWYPNDYWKSIQRLDSEQNFPNN